MQNSSRTAGAATTATMPTPAAISCERFITPRTRLAACPAVMERPLRQEHTTRCAWSARAVLGAAILHRDRERLVEGGRPGAELFGIPGWRNRPISLRIGAVT